MWRPQEAAQCEPWPDILARATRPRALTGLSRSSRWNGSPCLLPGATGRPVATTCRPPWVISISTVSIIDVGASDLDLPPGGQHGASPAIDQKPQSRLCTSLPFRCRSPVLRTRNGRSCAAWSWCRLPTLRVEPVQLLHPALDARDALRLTLLEVETEVTLPASQPPALLAHNLQRGFSLLPADLAHLGLALALPV